MTTKELKKDFKKIDRYSKGLSFVFNGLRWIPNILFGIIFFIAYSIAHIFNVKKYRENLTVWKKVCNKNSTIEGIINYFVKVYTYKYDFLKGFCDHDSLIQEWILGFGDCDDRALYLKKCLNTIGIPAIRIGIKGKGFTDFHYEALFYYNDSYCVLYGGRILSSNTVEGVLKKFGELWNIFEYDKTKYCVSLY